MGLFKKRAADPAEIERLRSEIAAMGARLDAADRRLEATGTGQAEIVQQVDQIVARLDTPLAPPPDEPPPTPPAAVDPVELETLGHRIDAIVARLDTPLAPPPDEPPPTSPASVDAAELETLGRRIDELMSRLDGVDARITSISTELANQIDELSGEIEVLATSQPPPGDEIVEELRDAQTRLANEQARYQIAFRQDLADLADRLRRR